MCGIAGIFSYGGAATPVDEAALRPAHDVLAPRGPDGEGFWISDDRRTGFAHRRLSIIDLSEAGAQPMSLSADGNNLTIIFNGEIYNHAALRKELEAGGAAFRSQSDTEVLLHLYAKHGAAMVHKLRGMFAFAIHDATAGGIFLARDPYGIKPLYYAEDKNQFRFASQVRALLAGGSVDTAPSAAGHVGFFLTGYVPEPHTLYRGIKSLPAGSSLWVDSSGRGAPHRWFDISRILAEAEPIAFSAESLRAALAESVRHHMIADVPVGVFLSSGLDSATLAALASELEGSALRTVTLGFDEYRGGEHDETILAEAIARHYGTSHETRWIARKDFEQEADALFAAMDQPTIDGVNSYFVSKVTREAGLKVALSGVGGDELFGGYAGFQEIPSLVRKFGLFRFVPGFGKAIREISAPLVQRLASPKYAGVIEYGTRHSDAYLLRRGLFMPWELPAFMDPDLVAEGLAEIAIREEAADTIDGLTTPRQIVTALESSWYMRNQLLRDADWAGMAHGLEIRTPLVDATLLGQLAPMLAADAPPGKQDMARTPAKPLPDEVLNRPKTGFSIPVREWLGSAGPASGGAGYRDWAKEVHKKLWTGDSGLIHG